MRRVYLEIDWLPVDAFIASCYTRSLGFNLPLHLGEVIPFATVYMMELSPFLLTGDAGRGVRHVYFIVGGLVVPFARYVDELKNQGSSCNYAAPSR